jgi:hypothetical protein
LGEALRADTRLAVVVVGGGGAAALAGDPLAPALPLLAEARQAWAELDAPQVLARLAQAEALTRPWLVSAEAAALLARALRLRGVVSLFLQKPEEASRSFVAAFLLEPAFAPGAEEWPPEARLAYADAVAAVRRAAPGALSVRVEPAVADVWLDGRLAGVGPTTVDGLVPGDHHLVVTCAGHGRFAAVVPVTGNGTLEQVDVFLPPLAPAERQRQAAEALLEGFASPHESRVARQAATLLGATGLILVATETGGGGRAVGWALNAAGERLGGAVSLADHAAAAAELAFRIAGGDLPAPAAPPPPWYLRWYTLAAVGAVIVGGGIALGVALYDGDGDRVSFHYGD